MLTLQYVFVNTSKKPSSAFLVSSRYNYVDYKPPESDKDSTGMKYQENDFLLPGWSARCDFGGGVLKKSGGIPVVGPLVRFELFVESVTFADGTRWSESPPTGKSQD